MAGMVQFHKHMFLVNHDRTYQRLPLGHFMLYLVHASCQKLVANFHRALSRNDISVTIGSVRLLTKTWEAYIATPIGMVRLTRTW